MFYVYVLYSLKDQGLYIGFTANLHRRWREHEAGEAAATAWRRPFVLAYFEAYAERGDAEGRERFLKSGAGRAYLKKQMRRFFELHPLRVASE